MPENQIQEREAPKVDWAAMEADFGSGNAPVVEEKVEVKVDEKDPNEIVNTEIKEEVKVEEVKPEAKAEEKVEEKTEEVVPEPVLEFKAEDIEGYKKQAEDGTWKAVGELLEVEVADESPEALVTALEAKYKPLIEEARKYSIDEQLSKYKPETVAAIKLMEMGYSEEDAFNPTGKLKGFLSLSDAELVRTNLEGLEGWDEERVGLEMEKLTERPEMLKHEALKLKEWVNSEIQRKDTERDALIQQYAQNKDKVVAQQREQHLNQVKEAVMSAESFLGAKINSDAKSEIFQKYSRGDYGDIFKDGKSVADYLLFKSFGNKILDEAKRGFYAKGKEEVTKQMLNIPPKQGEVSQKVVEKAASNNQYNEAVKILGGDFG